VIGAVLALLAAGLWDRPFTVENAGEATATVRARCGGCDWASRTRTGAMLVLDLDGRYSQNLVLSRGEGPVDYAVALGALAAGPHRLQIRLDRKWTPRAVESVAVDAVDVALVAPDAPERLALAWAPVLHPRGNELGRFTDVPLVMWYETDKTARGTRIRYSVIFSNEDGGTPADRLLATWGRLTDIEYVLGLEIAPDGRVLEATYQAPSHKILPYGRIVPGRHPELWVVTDNNMVSDHGATRPVFAPVAVPFDLSGTSREAVMDANPWTYEVSSKEAVLEGRVAAASDPHAHTIVDPRRYVYVEACAETRDAALTFGVGIDGRDGLRWFESDAGQKPYRIIRQPSEFPNGCFRGAVALPADTATASIKAMRFHAYTRSPREGEDPLPPGAGKATLVRVNRVFRLDADYQPGRDLFTWSGALPLAVEGPPAQIDMGPR